MTERRRRVLSRDELGQLRSADDVLHEAERTLEQSRKTAEAMERRIMDEARQRAVQESMRTAARIIAEAETTARRRFDALEPELAQLVAATVREILGDFEPAEASFLAARAALRRLADHRACRVFAHSDSVPPVRRAVEQLESEGTPAAGVEAIVADDRMEPGRAIVTSERGQAEIGLAALTEKALRSWDERPASGAPGDAADAPDRNAQSGHAPDGDTP